MDAMLRGTKYGLTISKSADAHGGGSITEAENLLKTHTVCSNKPGKFIRTRLPRPDYFDVAR